MADLRLVIGNKNYSSWSMRAWLLLARVGVEFSETVIPLLSPASEERLAGICPAGLVPVLFIDDEPVWDSLAIAETLAELFPEKNLWPEDFRARSLARSVSAEMHSGFFHLRNTMPMNCRQVTKAHAFSKEVRRDIERIESIWSSCRKQYSNSGPWLFGEYSIADAMYAPVASRFNSYPVKLSDNAKEYVDIVMSDACMREWYREAEEESWAIDEIDALFLD